MKFFAFCLVLILVFFFVRMRFSVTSTSDKNDIANKPNQETKLIRTSINLDGERYILILREVDLSEDLKLISNFSQGLRSQEVFQREECDFVINGGFYTPDNQPLGLFFLNGEILGPKVQSSLLNGFLTLNKSGVTQLTNQAPSNLDDYEFVLQSGPYILLDNIAHERFDETPSRRALVAQSRSGNTYFLIIFEEENHFSGPTLSQLKPLLSEISQIEKLDLKKAINLDGGTSLAFLQSGEPSITEVKKSGSFLCAKN